MCALAAPWGNYSIKRVIYSPLQIKNTYILKRTHYNTTIIFKCVPVASNFIFLFFSKGSALLKTVIGLICAHSLKVTKQIEIYFNTKRRVNIKNSGEYI